MKLAKWHCGTQRSANRFAPLPSHAEANARPSRLQENLLPSVKTTELLLFSMQTTCSQFVNGRTEKEKKLVLFNFRLTPSTVQSEAKTNM